MPNINLAEFSRSLPRQDDWVWNWIINPQFTINTRGASTKAQASGVYGYDRWKGASTAGSLVQVVESLPLGNYTLRYSTPSETVEEAVIHTGGNLTVTVPDDATWVELYDAAASGSAVRPKGFEQMLCASYCQRMDINAQFQAGQPNDVMEYPVLWTPMRAAPTATVSAPGVVTNASTADLVVKTDRAGMFHLVATAAGAVIVEDKVVILSAEL